MHAASQWSPMWLLAHSKCKYRLGWSCHTAAHTTHTWQALEGSVCVCVWRGVVAGQGEDRGGLCGAGEAGMQLCLSSLGVITLSSSGAACLRGLAEPGLMNKQKAAGQRIPLLLLNCTSRTHHSLKTLLGYVCLIQPGSNRAAWIISNILNLSTITIPFWSCLLWSLSWLIWWKSVDKSGWSKPWIPKGDS